MNPEKYYPGLAVGGIALALCSSFYLGQSARPFDLIRARFCPKTANAWQKGAKKPAEAQAKLDKVYCRNRHMMLKETWERMQFENPYPIPESSLRIQVIPRENVPQIYLLLAPFFVGISYLSWGRKTELDSQSMFWDLEGYKISIKARGENARQERSFKVDTIKGSWDIKRVKTGLISEELVRDKAQKQEEVSEKTHELALKSFDVDASEMAKKIAENLLDKTKAEKEAAKLSKQKTKEHYHEDTEKVIKDDLINALKTHEDGWLWTIISSIKPLFLYGDAGTGKTNTSVSIGLIRKYCLNIPVYRVGDRHLKGENKALWDLLKAEIKHSDDNDILLGLIDVCKRREDRINNVPDEPEQFILDEFTQLKAFNKQIVEQFVLSTFSDCRKAKEYFVGATHNLTNTTFGEGTSEMRSQGFIIKKFTVDGYKPIPRVVVQTGLKDDKGNELVDVEKTMPSWFKAEIIHAHLTNKKLIEF